MISAILKLIRNRAGYNNPITIPIAMTEPGNNNKGRQVVKILLIKGKWQSRPGIRICKGNWIGITLWKRGKWI